MTSTRKWATSSIAAAFLVAGLGAASAQGGGGAANPDSPRNITPGNPTAPGASSFGTGTGSRAVAADKLPKKKMAKKRKKSHKSAMMTPMKGEAAQPGGAKPN